MNKLFTTAILVLAPFLLFAQGVISGTVTDADTKLPLEGASVFAQNTTKGTITTKEGTFKLALDKGAYEINITFSGYTGRTLNLDVTADRTFNLELQKGDNALAEVIIKNSNEVPDGWAKYGRFFTDHFIGATPNADSCQLLNPEALKFLYFKRNDRLKVLATEPLRIQNNALGYTLRYELDSFVYYYKTDINTYRGKCLFLPMDSTSAQQPAWVKNRRAAYQGSRLQFIRSYLDSTLTQNGFTVDALSSTRQNDFDPIPNPYDTAYYFYNDTTATAELFFPVKVSITYNNKAPEKRYLQQYKLPLNVPIQITYVDLADVITLRPNGYFTDQKSWTNQGYWSWKNVADMLPYDYEE